MLLLCGTPIDRQTSRHWTKFNTVPSDMCFMTIILTLLTVAPTWFMNLGGLKDMRYVAKHCLLYKIQHCLVDIDSAAYLKPSDSRTRNQTAFFQVCTNSEVYYNFFPRTVRKWNMLPSTVTSAPTVDSFRVSLFARRTLLNYAETRALFVNSSTVFNQRHGTSCFYLQCVWHAGPVTFHLWIPALLLEEEGQLSARSVRGLPGLPHMQHLLGGCLSHITTLWHTLVQIL